MVVRRSMQTRYFLEMVFFFCLVCVFQYELLQFTETYNLNKS